MTVHAIREGRDMPASCDEPAASCTRRSSLAAALGVGLLTFLGGTSALHAQSYPNRAVTIMVPFAPGGSNDVIARIISEPLRASLGQPVVVENRGGAGGNLGMGLVARAAPDGYTLLLVSSVFAVNPAMYKSVPYDPLKDFVPVAGLASFPNILVSHPAAGIASIPQLIAKAKAEPGKLNYATSGAGTSGHLSVELLKLRSGVDLVHIPYTGAGPATQAVLGKTVDIGSMSISTALPYVSKELVPLAVTGHERWPGLTEVPTLEQAGIANAVTETWLGVFAPAGTPPAIVERLGKELREIASRPEIREKFRKAGFNAGGRFAEDFPAFIRGEVKRWKEIIPKVGLVR